MAIVCVTVVGCGSGSDHKAMIGQGSAVASCEQAAAGNGARDWRANATAVGRVGFFGEGRDFRTAQKQPIADYPALRKRGISAPILVTKVPVIVEGREPVTVAIAPADRARAGLVAGIPFGRGPFAEIRFVPCAHQVRTGWPAGWVLRSHDPVTVLIHESNAPGSQLVVGRP
jgi:hypothetical protein